MRIILKVSFLLPVILTPALASSSASSSMPLCYSYFMQRDVVQMFTPLEWQAVTNAAQSFADVLDQPHLQSREIKSEIDSQLRTFLRQKQFTALEQFYFSNLFINRVRSFYETSGTSGRSAFLRSKKGFVERQNILRHQNQIAEQRQHFENTVRLEKIFKKYHVTDKEEALCKSSYGNLENNHAVDASEVDFLLRMGANPNAPVRDSQGLTPLIHASQGTSVEMVRLLLEAKANVHSKDRSTMTPLLRAARSINMEIARLLIEAGADITSKDRRDRTALIWAVSEERANKDIERENLVVLLLNAGVDASAVNDRQESALDIAKRYSRDNVVSLIEAHLESLSSQK